jgi:hypothetical protein
MTKDIYTSAEVPSIDAGSMEVERFSGILPSQPFEAFQVISRGHRDRQQHFQSLGRCGEAIVISPGRSVTPGTRIRQFLVAMAAGASTSVLVCFVLAWCRPVKVRSRWYLRRRS